MVKIHTSLGVITLKLDNEKAPATVANFLQYAKNGFYDNTVFHRVINNFMIQGGGYLPGMILKETLPPINNEAANGLKNEAYTIAMARTPDPHSATSQFFINIANNDYLDYRGATPQEFGYCVFGKVVDGREVINEIKQVPTGSKEGHQDVPQNDILIERVETD